jgi:hypothetical protein
VGAQPGDHRLLLRKTEPYEHKVRLGVGHLGAELRVTSLVLLEAEIGAERAGDAQATTVGGEPFGGPGRAVRYPRIAADASAPRGGPDPS